MRIGINASFLRKPGTGIGQVTFNFLETLKEFPTRQSDGQASNFQFPNDGSVEFFIYTEEPFSRQYPANFHCRHFLPFWKRDDLIRKMLWEKQVAREAKKDGCTVFLSLYQSSTLIPKPLRHVMVVHDMIPRLFPGYQGNGRQRWHWRATEKGIAQADAIVAVSQATRNDLVAFGVAAEKISVASPDTAPLFHKELALEEENRVMAHYGLVPGYFYHGGGLEIRKNTEGLLRAYALLVEKERQGALAVALPALVISGKIFPEGNLLATPVKRLVQDLALSERVRLLDFVPEADLPALYKNALCFVYPSYYEGFGLPVLEALRMGTPVLTSDTSSLPEVAGEAALYIDPHTIESIASGMERLLTDVSLRTTLCAAAKQQASRFGWTQFVTDVCETFETKL